MARCRLPTPPDASLQPLTLRLQKIHFRLQLQLTGLQLIQNASELPPGLHRVGVLFLCLFQVLMSGCSFLEMEGKADIPGDTVGGRQAQAALKREKARK